jgi:hypothetical protein
MGTENPDETNLPNLIPEAREFVFEVRARTGKKDPLLQTEGWAHAAAVLALGLARYSLYNSQEEQRLALNQQAQKLVETYGKKIIPLLRDELKLAYTDPDG